MTTKILQEDGAEMANYTGLLDYMLEYVVFLPIKS